MITLKRDANVAVQQLCREDGVSAFWHDVCDKYTNGYVQIFITDLQTLITKVGIIIAKVSTHGVNISYCSQSIHYLCSKVLNRPELEKEFENVGINEKGNKGKHDIVSNKINLDQAVAAFNRMINGIASKYNLPALQSLAIIKRGVVKARKVEPEMQKKPIKNKIIVPAVTPQIVSMPKPKKKKIKHIQEKATSWDEKIALTASLTKGDGYFKQGIIFGKKKLNFNLRIYINNFNKLKVKSLSAEFVCGKNKISKEIKVLEHKDSNNIEAPITLDANMFSGNIKAMVTMEYKIGMFKTKTIKASVSKSF